MSIYQITQNGTCRGDEAGLGMVILITDFTSLAVEVIFFDAEKFTQPLALLQIALYP